jgi:glycosyltransferase involved in cell wall biosynthesis
VTAKVPVSAVLITRDAERHLGSVLAPLGICSEIVILDSGSHDRTREIARCAGARWFEHPFEGFGPQKRRAVALAEHDWVLSIDADELLDGDAVAGLGSIDWMAQDPATCWRLRRRPFIGRQEIRHGHWVPDFVIRIFNRRHHDFSDTVVHETVTPTGPVRTLPGSLLHYSYADMADLFGPEYHRLKAVRYRSEGRRAGGALLTVRAAAVFFKSYVLRRGFLDGRAGVVVALAGAVNAVVGLALAGEQDVHRLDEWSSLQ